MSSSSTITTPPDTTPTITNINNIMRNYYNGTTDSRFYNPITNWNPPQFTPNIPNNCNIYNNELRNTNENCLRALINNCNISIENQNNVINYNNCTSLLNYTKSLVNSNITTHQNWLNTYNKFGEWKCNDGACWAWNSISVPGNDYCIEYSRGECGCPLGFGRRMYKYKGSNCTEIGRVQNVLNSTQVAKSALDNISCPSIQMIPTPAINCCNNVLNCEFAECINIIQTCKQTINGETEISNATQCSTSKCPMNDQKCIAGTPGAGIFNWVCQNNTWKRSPPTATAPAPAPPPATSPPTPEPVPISPVPTPAPISPVPPTPAPPTSTPISPTPPTSTPTSSKPVPSISSKPAPSISPTSFPSASQPTTNYTLFIIIFIIVIILFVASFYFIK